MPATVSADTRLVSVTPMVTVHVPGLSLEWVSMALCEPISGRVLLFRSLGKVFQSGAVINDDAEDEGVLRSAQGPAAAATGTEVVGLAGA